MSRPIPPAALALVHRFERDPRTGSFAAQKYEDPPGSGEYSIGWGHHILPHEAWPDVIDLAAADEQAQFDLENAASEVDRLVAPAALADLTDNQYAALIDFVFNEGAGHLASSTLLRLINQHAFARAGNEFPRWDYVAGEPAAGLLTRRQAEQDLWMTGLPGAAAA